METPSMFLSTPFLSTPARYKLDRDREVIEKENLGRERVSITKEVPRFR